MENTKFEILAKKLTPTLKRIAYRLNGHFTHFNHDDLFQESLLHLWNNFSVGKLQDKTDSYILQGCYFHLKNYIRKTRDYSGLISLEELLNHGDQENQDCTFLMKDKNFQDNRRVINNQMLADTIMNNGLTSKEKLLLVFIKDGLTTREIGVKLGVSHVIVVRRMSQIRQKCRKYLDKD